MLYTAYVPHISSAPHKNKVQISLWFFPIRKKTAMSEINCAAVHVSTSMLQIISIVIIYRITQWNRL